MWNWATQTLAQFGNSQSLATAPFNFQRAIPTQVRESSASTFRVEFVEINERFERNTDAEQTHVGSVHLLYAASLVPTHREHTYFCQT